MPKPTIHFRRFIYDLVAEGDLVDEIEGAWVISRSLPHDGLCSPKTKHRPSINKRKLNFERATLAMRNDTGSNICKSAVAETQNCPFSSPVSGVIH
ncbi:MAG: hypothetical protein ACLPKZ_07855, partial [Acidimicrobiales bacterium]